MPKCRLKAEKIERGAYRGTFTPPLNKERVKEGKIGQNRVTGKFGEKTQNLFGAKSCRSKGFQSSPLNVGRSLDDHRKATWLPALKPSGRETPQGMNFGMSERRGGKNHFSGRT